MPHPVDFDLNIGPRLEARMITNNQLFVASSNLIEIDKLNDRDQFVAGNPPTIVYLNDATVTMRLLDSAGVLVVGSDVALANKVGSNGRYRATLPVSVGDLLVVDDIFTVEITAIAAGGSPKIVGTKALPARNYKFR